MALQPGVLMNASCTQREPKAHTPTLRMRASAQILKAHTLHRRQDPAAYSLKVGNVAVLQSKTNENRKSSINQLYT